MLRRVDLLFGGEGRCCTEPNGWMWIPAWPSSDANRNGLCDPDHTVEHPHPKRTLARTTGLAGEEPEAAEAGALTQADEALLADYWRRHGPGALGDPSGRDEPTGDGGDAP